MRRSVLVALAIVAGCDSYGEEERGRPGGTDAGTSIDGSIESDGAVTIDGSTDAPTDAGTDAQLDGGGGFGCGLPVFSDDFERTAVQGAWPTLTTDPTITLGIAGPGSSSASALKVNVGAGSSFRSAYLERSFTPAMCREIEFELFVGSFPTATSVAVAGLVLDGSNTGGIVIALNASAEVVIGEEIMGAVSDLGTFSMPLQAFKKIVVRVAALQVTMSVDGAQKLAMRALTSKPVAALRMGAVQAKTSGATYVVDNVVFR